MKSAAFCARPAVARELQAGLAAQQFLERVGARVADALGIDHDHVGGDAVERLRFARRDDDDRREAGLRHGGRDKRQTGESTQQGRRAARGARGAEWKEIMSESNPNEVQRPASPQAHATWRRHEAATARWPVSGLAERPLRPSRRPVPPSG